KIEDLITYSNAVYQLIKNSKGKIDLEVGKPILKNLHLSKLSDNTKDKSDIRIVIYDPITQFEPQLGFSIKSYIGSKPTLFNAGKPTNIVFKIHGAMDTSLAEKLNSEGTYSDRIKYLLNNNLFLKYDDYWDEKFKDNLELIDSRLPEILAEMVLLKYTEGISKLNDIIVRISDLNPCGFNIINNENFYSYKIKRFLIDCALGMTAKSVWTGTYDASGGFIVVKSDGDMVCFH